MNDASADKTLTYREVADLLEEHFGVRPALSTLRAAALRRDQATSTASITAGIPAPAPMQRGLPAAQVRHWIDHHPWKSRASALEALENSHRADAAGRDAAVEKARQAGLSWNDIARAISTADDVTYTRQAAQQRYGRRIR